MITMTWFCSQRGGGGQKRVKKLRSYLMYGPLGKTSLWQPQGETGNSKIWQICLQVCQSLIIRGLRYVQILYNSEALKLARYLFDVSANLAEVLICYLHPFQ